ncbi:MAG TPA: nicotinamide mononucleotide transporter family protein [Micromonosporaceae bacterium]
MSDLIGWANEVAFTFGQQRVLWADLLGNAAALATVGLALRRSVWTWPVQITCSILLFGASMAAHLGGNASRQVLLGSLAVYGWWKWTRDRRNAAEPSERVRVAWASARQRIVLLAALVVGTVAFAWLLSVTHTSWAPLPDAYIFIGSAVATFAQARGLVEFWLVWILVDLVGVPLAWTHGLVVSGLVYGVFFAMCVWGLVDWARAARRRTSATISAESGTQLADSVQTN